METEVSAVPDNMNCVYVTTFNLMHSHELAHEFTQQQSK